VGFLMNTKDKLEAYRNAVLGAWVQWRQEILEQGVMWLTT